MSDERINRALCEEAKKKEIKDFLDVAKQAVWSLDLPYEVSFGGKGTPPHNRKGLC